MSSIPSSAMPHAKAHDDEDEAHANGASTQAGPADGADHDGAQAKLAEVKEQATAVQEKVTDQAAKLTERAKSEAQEHPKTGIAIGAVVAVGVAALAAIPFFLSRSDAKKPKPRKAKPKPKARKSAA